MINSRTIFLVVLLLTAGFYGVVGKYDFVWDDYLLIVHNPTIYKPLSIGDFFSSGLWNSSLMVNTPNSYYRPIVSFAYALQFKLFGMKAGGFHMVSLLIHCLNLFFLWLIASRLELKKRALFFSLMVFSFHPVQVSAISFISCQGDLLALLFSLITMFVWIKNDHRKYWSILPAMAALLCKETAILLPAGLVVYDVLIRKTSYVKWKTYLPLLILIPYFILRKIVLGAGLPASLVDHWYETLGSFRTLKFIGRIFFPIPAMPEEVNLTLKLWKTLLSHAGLLIVLTLGWFKAFKEEKSRWLFVWFLFGMMPIADWPGSNLRFSDQLLYVAMAPAVLLFGFLLNQTSRKINMVALLIMIPLCVLSQQQLGVWRNSETLWGYALSLDPKNILANTSYGAGLFEMGKKKEACEHNYKTLVMTLENPNPIAQQALTFNLGKCFEIDHPNVAEKYFRASIDISKGEDWASISNLGFLLFRTGDLNGAEKIANQMVLQHPDIFYSWKLLGLVQQSRGLKNEGLSSFERAFKLNPADAELPGLMQTVQK